MGSIYESPRKESDDGKVPLERIVLTSPASLRDELWEFYKDLPFDLFIGNYKDDDPICRDRKVVIKMNYEGGYKSPYRMVEIYPSKIETLESTTTKGEDGKEIRVPYLKEVGTVSTEIRIINPEYRWEDLGGHPNFETFSNGTILVNVYRKPR